MARYYYQRPENALKRAKEFEEVGKPTRALDALYDVIKSKKKVHQYSEKNIEPCMFKYLDLCVELKKSHIAKEGLFQYRNMCQSVNPASLENVVRFYLNLADERTEAARKESHQSVIDIDDLDNLATPESILLSAVSGEDAQARSDRTILTPWVKFLWESYCQCLELLRTNSRVERLYHEIAHLAFKFCLKYSRKTEFRKLCEKLRNHLDHIMKLPSAPPNINLNNAETQQMNLETRLVQLDHAIQMELWQEAYKAIEDIHGLMILSKKMPQPKMMANYYQKLALVFWKAGNHLFHAAAIFKLFQLSKEMKKNISPEEIQKMAARVLVSVLAVPLPSAHPEYDRFIETDKSPMEKMQRLATLLGLAQPPTRASLIKDLIRCNVVRNTMPQLQDLYRWLEVEFHPLKLCTRIQSCIDFINTEELAYIQQYIPAVQDLTLMRLLKQVSQVYQTIEFSRLLELAHFATPFHLERIIVDAVRHNDMQIRIDHRSRSIHFGTDLSESQREDLPEGPTLQSMPSEQVRNQLVSMYRVLHRSVGIIQPLKKKSEREELQKQIVLAYHQTKNREHQRILARHKIIEDRKEYLEKLNIVKEEEEARRQEEVLRQQMLTEQKRLDQEREERERKRQEEEFREIQARHLTAKLAQISQTSIGQKVIKKIEEEDIMKMDADQIMARQLEELEKERRDLLQKLKAQEKKVDYLERAKRHEELPLLQQQFKEKQLKDKTFWEQQENERIAVLHEERASAVEQHTRLTRMKDDKNKFLDSLKAARSTVFKEKLDEFNKMIDIERKKRLLERKEQRKVDRRNKWIKEREEEEQRKRNEEIKRKRKEEEKLEMERKAAEEEEYRKQKEEMDALEAKKREMKERLQRSEEEQQQETWRRSRRPPRDDVDNWRRADEGERGGRDGREDDKGRTRDPTSQPWRPGGGSTANWREKMKARAEQWGPRIDDPDRDSRGRRDDPRDSRDDPRDRRDDDRDDWRRGGRDRGFGDRDDRSSWRRDDRDRDFGGPRRDREDDYMRRRDDKLRDDRDRRPPFRDERERRPPFRDSDRGGGGSGGFDNPDWRAAPRDDDRRVGGGFWDRDRDMGKDRDRWGRDDDRDRRLRDDDRDRRLRDDDRERRPRDDMDRRPREDDRDRWMRDDDGERRSREEDRERRPRDDDRERRPRDDRERRTRDDVRDRRSHDDARDSRPRIEDRDRQPREDEKDRKLHSDRDHRALENDQNHQAHENDRDHWSRDDDTGSHREQFQEEMEDGWTKVARR